MISLRPATLADCAQVWAWRFADDVRATSADPRHVELADHTAWFAARLAQRDAPMWIVEDAGAGVGVVRLDPLPDGAGLISIVLSRTARGRGLGRAAIAAACTQWNRRVIAMIRADNGASQACFEACGFRRIDRVLDLITYAWSSDGKS